MDKEGTQLIRGLEGVVAAETKLCDLDGRNGRLAYGGYDIEDLARRASFEEVCHLLWYGELPNAAQLDKMTLALIAAREIPADLVQAFRLMPKATDPMRVLQAAVAILGMSDPDTTDNSHAANIRKAIRLTSQMATAICAHHRVRSGEDPIRPASDLSHAGNFLYMLTGKRPSGVVAKAIDASLTLYAEHELNASTFTTRCIVSTQSDMHSAVAGGVGRPQGTAPRRRRRGSHAHLDGDRRGRQRRRVHREGDGRQAAIHGHGSSRLQGGRPARRDPQGNGRGGVPAVGPVQVVRDGREAPRAHQRGEEADSRTSTSTRRRSSTRSAFPSISSRR